MSSFALFGDSPEARIFRALLPALALSAWFIIGVAVYAIRVRLKGEFRDTDIEAKGASTLLGMWLRRYFVWVIRPVWLPLAASGIPANAITTLSVMMAFASGVGFAAGHFALAGWLYIFSGILDIFDGRLARLRGTSGPAGAVLDSVLDRYADAAVLIGLAWFYRDSWVLVPALLALAGGFTVSYVRARAESIGLAMRVGLMQRPERVLTLGAATALSPVVAAWQSPGDPTAPHWLAIGGLVFLAASTQWTSAQRLVHVLRELNGNQSSGTLLAKNGLVRASVTALLATAADFALVYCLVEYAAVSPWMATATGCVLGAAVSFSLGRSWAFVNAGAAVKVQLGRYAFVSLTSAMLNSGGVFVFSLLPAVDYRIGWLLVRGAVFVLWNYSLHREYVFGNAPESSRDAGGAHPPPADALGAAQ